MNKIERIAKLHELRNAGGLTDEEFERQKSRLLAGPRWLLLLCLTLFAAVTAAGITYFWIAPKYSAGTPVPEAPARTGGQSRDLGDPTGPAEVLPKTVPQTAVATPNSSKLAEIFAPATLGARIAYLENMTGVARNAIGDMRTYNVEGCEIQALVRGGVVNGLAMNVSPKCTFDLGLFFTNEHFGSANRLLFGEIPKQFGSGRMSADCLESCGNAADPDVRITGGGAHADNWYTLTAETTTAATDASTAAQVWTTPMVADKGDDWVIAGSFNCDHSYDRIALPAFSSVKATRVIVGDGSVEPKCSDTWPL